MNSTIDTAIDIPETTTYFADQTTPGYADEYDWVYYYSYYGIPAVNDGTMRKWQPTVYVIILGIFGFTIFGLAALALQSIRRNERLTESLSYFLLGATLIYIIKGIQILFHFQCVVTLRPYNPEFTTYSRFNCLDDRGYPGSFLMLNQLLSGYALAAITCHRLLHWMVVMNRLLATHFQGRFFSFLGRVDGLMVFICVICGASPWFLQIGPGHPYMAAEGQYGNLGAYFNPLTFRIGQYWPYEGYATWGPMANKLSILIDIFIVVAEVKSLQKLKKMFRENPCNYIDVRYQKFLCVQHPMLIIAWLMDIIFYDVFCVKFPTQYNYAKMHMFLLEHMPGWFFGICGSISVIIMNKGSSHPEKPANSKSTASKKSHNTGSTTFAA